MANAEATINDLLHGARKLFMAGRDGEVTLPGEGNMLQKHLVLQQGCVKFLLFDPLL